LKMKIINELLVDLKKWQKTKLTQFMLKYFMHRN
jgi:hypothetical protein